MLLDIEINMNHHLLTYIENDIQYPVLKPKIVILMREITVLGGGNLNLNMEVTERNNNVISRVAKIRLGGDSKENI